MSLHLGDQLLVDVDLAVEVFSLVLEGFFQVLDVVDVSIFYLLGFFIGHFPLLFKLKLEHLNILDVFSHRILLLGQLLVFV